MKLVHGSIILTVLLLMAFTTGLTAEPDAATPRQQRYVLHDLGTLGGLESYAYALNERGDVVGASQVKSGGPVRAFLFFNGKMVDIGPPRQGGRSFSMGINDRGAIVGQAAGPDRTERAFVYRDGNLQFLGGPLNSSSTARSVNSKGDCVGYTLGSRPRGFVMKNGTVMQLLEAGGSLSTATDLNDNSVVMGWYEKTRGTGDYRACRWRDGVLEDLGTLGGDRSEANAVNARSEIVGSSADGKQ
jgi:probable HAF family extracellular repeat protein